jgi:hypothetical protein
MTTPKARRRCLPRSALGLSLDDEAKGGDMRKAKHLLAVLAALATGMTLALVLASSVTAATVTHTILLTDESEPFYACSFPLSATFSGTVRLTEIDTAHGAQLLFTSVGPTTVTVTNPANGKSITGMGQTAGEILKISAEGRADTRSTARVPWK